MTFGQEGVRKLVTLTRVTLRFLRTKISATKIGISGRIKSQDKEVVKQGWDSFHYSPPAFRDVREVFVPSGGEVTDFSIWNKCNIRMADLWGEHALDSNVGTSMTGIC